MTELRKAIAHLMQTQRERAEGAPAAEPPVIPTDGAHADRQVTPPPAPPLAEPPAAVPVTPETPPLPSAPTMSRMREPMGHDVYAALREWDRTLGELLAARYSPAEAVRLAARYGAAFPPAYKASIGVADALADIRVIEMVDGGRAQIELVDDSANPELGLTALKLYLPDERLVLSDFVPVLENLGLRVFGEDSVVLSLPDGPPIHLQTFLVRDVSQGRLEVGRAAPLLVPALHAVRAGLCDNDALNRLILHAGLEWRAVAVLRAYVEHTRQTGAAPSRSVLFDALTAHPHSARRLFRFFAARFEPGVSPLAPSERVRGLGAEAEASFLASLDQVDSVLHDRLLRALGAAVAATVRTNFYRTDLTGPEVAGIALKLDCRRLSHLPPPHPLFEVVVHSPQVTGIHLRAARVARGGIRLSDRPDDFRTEVLGLMKTQVVKNAVIVPSGAKGGFVVRGAVPGVPPARERVERAYRTFIGALLSITDNLEQGRPVPPAGVLRYDDADPYLVVAADRGTATFSDIANEVAARYRFWLGDAFASGGSHGYDHKAIGITSRGAWECVRHHFLALGRDADRDPLTVIGIGDMGGDVFGNGLLHSRALRLRAAFNHTHIFLDPDPDPAASFAERERLFRLPGSSWSDYHPALISAGGGVFARRAKSVRLAPSAQTMLGIDQSELSGEELIRAILAMEADLLWNGGIGTYVKASDETDAQVGDPANDAVRVNASALRVRVVGEGGNLGFTQAARVEFALRGGHINTDAIDNSGGVDLSDHEVNLKIAFQPLLASRVLSASDRNRLLDELTDDVCERVLTHNRRQARALTLDQTRSRTNLAAFRELATALESAAGLDRQLERLPTRETLRQRRGNYLGLTRPELAVLLAYTKIDLQHRLLDSTLPEDPIVARCLELYFPAVVLERCGDGVRQHSLRREIIAVELANRLVDAMGMTFLSRIATSTGFAIVDVVRAWTAALLITDADDAIRALESAPAGWPATAVDASYLAIEQALEQATKWILETQGAAASISSLVERFAVPVTALLGQLAARQQTPGEPLATLGLEAQLAQRIGHLDAAADAFEIAHIAGERETALASTAESYLVAAELVDLGWIRDILRTLAQSDDRWERRAVEGLEEDLRNARRVLTCEVLVGAGSGVVRQGLESYRVTHGAQLEALRRLIDDIRGAPRVTLAAVLVLLRALGHLARR